MTYALVIHGGAGAQPGTDYTAQKTHMGKLIKQGQDMLLAGQSAVDVVEAMVAEMESSGLYVAGKGSAPNTDGIIELDASIMDGQNKRAGGVAAISNIKHPIRAARKVMDDGKHVMLAGAGAREFAQSHGMELIGDPALYYSEHEKHGSAEYETGHGTVGAVALDTHGHLAAATSTGGTFGKSSGRIGDTPIIGSGTWADAEVAVSCTGLGEAFMRTCAAHDVAARMQYGGHPINTASWAVLDEVSKCGGDGGLIAIDKKGMIAMPYNSDGMKRAAVSNTLDAVVLVFEREVR